MKLYLSENGRAVGHRVAQAALSARRGVCAPRADVLSALRSRDPEAVAARRERILPRRTYTVEQAMVLWHIDCELCHELSVVRQCAQNGKAYALMCRL